jgi:rare lipoprotein A
MMRKYCAIALIATTALLASSHHSASARSASRQDGSAQPPADRHAAGWVGETGSASYYSNAYNGRRAANGVRFDQRLLTAAHAWLPFGTNPHFSYWRVATDRTFWNGTESWCSFAL